jgi:hypothetical protein
VEVGPVVHVSENVPVGRVFRIRAAAVRCRRGATVELADHGVARLPVQHGKVTVAVEGADHRISFKVAGLGAILGAGWRLRDGPLASHAAPAVLAAIAPPVRHCQMTFRSQRSPVYPD